MKGHKLENSSVSRCERCGKSAASVEYDVLLKKLVCSECDRELQIKRSRYASSKKIKQPGQG